MARKAQALSFGHKCCVSPQEAPTEGARAYIDAEQYTRKAAELPVKDMATNPGAQSSFFVVVGRSIRIQTLVTGDTDARRYLLQGHLRSVPGL